MARLSDYGTYLRHLMFWAVTPELKRWREAVDFELNRYCPCAACTRPSHWRT